MENGLFEDVLVVRDAERLHSSSKREENLETEESRGNGTLHPQRRYNQTREEEEEEEGGGGGGGGGGPEGWGRGSVQEGGVEVGEESRNEDISYIPHLRRRSEESRNEGTSYIPHLRRLSEESRNEDTSYIPHLRRRSCGRIGFKRLSKTVNKSSPTRPTWMREQKVIESFPPTPPPSFPSPSITGFLLLLLLLTRPKRCGSDVTSTTAPIRTPCPKPPDPPKPPTPTPPKGPTPPPSNFQPPTPP
ncbi:uncharacterized protein LOC135206884 [Macrobrachium nipponense]|uniref:uncharacterized protein LOC135206884 n=1 Tax=Macrobrachium nipponense TaxID=159736 RepID=UPI0030C8764C